MTTSFTASPFVGKTFGVTVSHLTKKFGRTTVLTDINLDIKPGDMPKFIEAVKENGANAVKEPGCREFNI